MTDTDNSGCNKFQREALRQFLLCPYKLFIEHTQTHTDQINKWKQKKSLDNFLDPYDLFSCFRSQQQLFRKLIQIRFHDCLPACEWRYVWPARQDREDLSALSVPAPSAWRREQFPLAPLAPRKDNNCAALQHHRSPLYAILRRSITLTPARAVPP